MTDTRPPQVGNYELMTDYESNEMTVRIFRMVAGVERVEPHVHQRSAQVYVPLVGQVTVEVDGVETIVNPYHVHRVAAGRAHHRRRPRGSVRSSPPGATPSTTATIRFLPMSRAVPTSVPTLGVMGSAATTTCLRSRQVCCRIGISIRSATSR